jgi:hypothetical protein
VLVRQLCYTEPGVVQQNTVRGAKRYKTTRKAHGKLRRTKQTEESFSGLEILPHEAFRMSFQPCARDMTFEVYIGNSTYIVLILQESKQISTTYNLYYREKWLVYLSD